jgi:plastocyanin
VFFATTGRKAHQAEIEESMQRKSLISVVPVLILLGLPGLIVGCSSKDKGTNPMPTAEPFESGNLSNTGPSSIFVHTFNTAGSFGYRCRIHSGMTGTVNVSVGAGDSVLVQIGPGNVFSPTPASVKPGGYVRWFNTGATHTVTRP